MRKLFILLPLALLALMLLPFMPHSEPAATITLPTPTTSASLPACIEEDGAGMALCTWDAQTQGNGYGNDVISGDCAPDIMGDEASALCVNLHSRPSETVTNEDGSINTVPNGADLIAECLYDWDGEDNTKSELADCIRAWM